MLSHNLLLTGDDGYNLTKSLRFRSSASAYLNRTPASAGNRRTWTYSTWIKRGTVGAEGTLISGGATTGRLCVFFNSSGNLVSDVGETGTFDQSTAVYRDPSAWYHFVWQFDTTQATAANRSRMYINGVAVALTNTRTFTQNADYQINNSVLQTLGVFSNSIGTYNFDGYMAEVNFIDGQALTPSSFGSTNALTGVWQPAKYTGTYGTNGFYLPFTNTASTTALGYDSSGNGNNWTTNNFSISSNSTYDSMNDVPTLTSATQANYAVLNPLDKRSLIELTNANLHVQADSSGSWGQVRSTVAFPTTGKWYWEFVFNTGTNSFSVNGIGNSGTSLSLDYAPSSWANVYQFMGSGTLYANNSSSSYGSSLSSGDVLMVAFDRDNSAIYFGKNGTWFNSSNPATQTSPAASSISTSLTFFPMCGSVNASGGDINFGQRPFSYTPPTGFVALNTFNLPTSTIVNGGKCMDATIYTGDGSQTKSFTNTFGFKPDLVWSKIRSGTTQGTGVFDSVRGTTGQSLDTASTSAEGTWNSALSSEYGYVSAFNSNGFSVDDGSVATTGGYVNYSGRTYVAWQWQAGQGTTSSNTSGSITSTVSVNASAGFSVVTYTGNATSGATVGHGLGVAPSMVIVKSRSAANNWCVYHISMGNQYATLLNSTASSYSNSNYWNNTSPTSTVFSLGNSNDTNQSSATFVAYCWTPIAGYSAFGSYTGNGSTDGPFIYTGFRPKFVIIKSSTYAGTDWVMYDSSRNTYNALTSELNPNTSGSENNFSGSARMDFLSNGIKIRTSGAGLNSSGDTYVYACFAENPFKYSNAR